MQAEECVLIEDQKYTRRLELSPVSDESNRGPGSKRANRCSALASLGRNPSPQVESHMGAGRTVLPAELSVNTTEQGLDSWNCTFVQRNMEDMKRRTSRSNWITTLLCASLLLPSASAGLLNQRQGDGSCSPKEAGSVSKPFAKLIQVIQAR